MTTIVRRPSKATSGRADAETIPEVASPPPNKIQIIVNRLSRTQGASIEELASATGWQKHSVRGAISGAIRKKLGLKVSSEKTDAGRIYRIAEAGR